jgi:DNA-directed RNA polymerase specialized sigma24 family protein
VSDSVNAVVFKRTKKAILETYEAYTRKEEGAEAKLFNLIRNFATTKVSHAVYEVEHGSETVDDHAQEVLIYVWQNISSFRGEPKAFYAWLHRICFTKGATAFNEYKDLSSKREPIFVESDVTGRIEDNPILNYNHTPVQLARKLPDFIKGTDLRICDMIRSGYDYAKIAKHLNIQEKTVEMRIRRMRNKIMEMKKNAACQAA